MNKMLKSNRLTLPLQDSNLNYKIDSTRIDQELQMVSQEVDRIILSVYQDDLYTILDNGLSPIEQEVRRKYNAIGRRLTSEINEIKANLIKEEELLIKEKGRIDLTELKSSYNKKYASKQKKRINKIEQEYHRISELSIKANIHKRQKEDAQIELAQIKRDLYPKYSPKKWLVHHWFPYLLVLLGIFLSDGAVLYFVIEALPDNDLPGPYIILIVSMVCFFLALANHFVGIALSNKQKRWEILIPTTILVLLLGIIFYLRIISPESALILALPNLAFCILATYWSYLRYKDHAYFRTLANWHKEEILENKYVALIERIKTNTPEQVKLLQQQFNNESELYVEDMSRQLDDAIKQRGIKKNQLEHFLDYNLIPRIQNMYVNSIEQLRTQIIRARAQNRLAPISFSEFSIQALEFVPASNRFPSPRITNGYPQEKMHINGKIKLWIPFILGILQLMGCMNSSTEHKEIYIVRDASMEIKDPSRISTSEALALEALKTIGFGGLLDSESIVPDQIDVKLTYIDDRYNREIISGPSLPASGSYFKQVKNNRLAQQIDFVQDLIYQLDEIPRPSPQGRPNSFVQACLCDIFNRIKLSQASDHLVIIESDMILKNDELGLNFYDFEGEDLLIDYDSISQKLDEDCSLMKELNLPSTEIYIWNFPKVKHDNFSRYVRLFWEKYLNSKGLKVNFENKVLKPISLK